MSNNFTKRQVVATCPLLRIDIRPNVVGVTVVVVGELDLATAPQLMDAIADCQGLVIYDLAGVSFLDARGLEALLAPGRNRVRIVSPSSSVERVIHILQLDGLIISDLGLRGANLSPPRVVAEESIGPNDWAVITLDGEIDLARADELAHVFASSWLPAQSLLVDLGRVTFMDSTGLHWLFNSQRVVAAAGGEMRLIVPEGGHMDWLLALVAADHVFTIYHNLDRALERISAGEVVEVMDGPKRDEFGPPDG